MNNTKMFVNGSLDFNFLNETFQNAFSAPAWQTLVNKTLAVCTKEGEEIVFLRIYEIIIITFF